MVFRMNYTKLTNNLIDLVKEEQAKLGYRKEAIRLYYPLSSLQHILGTTDSAEQLTEKLQKDIDVLQKERYTKFRKIGVFEEN